MWGPRPGKNDVKLNNEVKKIFESINWKCKVYKSYSKFNLGIVERTVKSLRWFFSNEEKGIIFEDDCLAHPNFFKFCELMLEKYKNEKKILMINGNNFQDGKIRGKYSYYFSEYFHYGWAGWEGQWNIMMKIWKLGLNGKDQRTGKI